MQVIARQRIQSLDRGLRILEYIAERDRPTRLGELADLLGVEKSSAHRLVNTLADRGYVRQDVDTLGYVLRDKVFELAGALASRRSVQEYARKYLRKLARETGETAHLAVPGDKNVVLMDHEFGENPVAVTTQWGSNEPLYCTALGKAILAGKSSAEMKELLGPGRLKRYTKNTITRIDELARQCRQVEKELVAFDIEEFNKGMNCLAGPVYDFRGQVVAAIGISGPVERVNKTTMGQMAELVRQCARKLSGELGYQAEKISPAQGSGS